MGAERHYYEQREQEFEARIAELEAALMKLREKLPRMYPDLPAEVLKDIDAALRKSNTSE